MSRLGSLRSARWPLLFVLSLAVTAPLPADDAPSPAAPLMKLIKSGRVPPERLGNIVELACQRGNAGDLAYLFDQATNADGFPPKLRLETLRWLADAAVNRKVQPSGDLSALSPLIQTEGNTDKPLQLAAIRLAGACRAKPLAAPLAEVALSEKNPANIRRAAVESLAGIDTAAAGKVARQLISTDQPYGLRALGVEALVGIDVDAAAAAAAGLIALADAQHNPGPVLDAFLAHKGGPDKLAAAVAARKIQPDPAKIALRHVYSVGRTDPVLVQALSAAAGLSGNPEPPTPEEVKELAAEVLANGDAARGEAIFRRADVSCMKCHAVSKAGGQVGPDLSAVGASSPVDYLINSIMQPNQAVKEAFLTRVVVTEEGKVFQGIVVDRDDQRVILKEATGQTVSIPVADIDEEFEGESLMPQGLTKFLTHDEVVDLVRFLSELGKPGAYAVRKTPTIQRWRVLRQVPDSLGGGEIDADMLREESLAFGDEAWSPVYAKVAGGLPLADVRKIAGGPVIYLRADVDVTVAGPIGFKIQSPLPLQVAIDDQPLRAEPEFRVELEPGRHQLHVLLEGDAAAAGDLRAELFRVDGSPAEFEVVGGQ